MADDRRPAVPADRLAGGSPTRQPGLRDVLLVAGAVVVTVLAAAAVTAVLPPGVRSLVTDTPLAIFVLIAVTVAVLLRVARDGSA